MNIGWKDGAPTMITLQSPVAHDITVRWGEKIKTFHMPAKAPTIIRSW